MSDEPMTDKPDGKTSVRAINNPTGHRSKSNMTSTSHIRTAALSLCVFVFMCSPSLAMISVGVLTKEAAKDKYGITMHARRNGDAGIKVWLTFKKEGWLEKFTY